MDTPIVSVVMPVFNAASTLDEAVESLQAQTLTAWELVAVDDGSTDGSLDMLRAWAARDARVRVVALGHEGIVPALNAGLSEARAPLIARMDADDVCLPGRLLAQVDHLGAHADIGVVGCGVEMFPRTGLTAGMLHYEEWLNSVVEPADVDREMYVESPLAHPSVVFRGDVVQAAGGYREGPFPEDYDLWLRLHARGVRMGKVPAVLLRWRDGCARLSRTDGRYSRDAFRELKAHHLARSWLAGRNEVQIWGAGPDGRRWRRALAAEGIRVTRFFDIDPRKVGRVLGGGAPVLDWKEIPNHRGTPLLYAVGVKGARALVRQALADMGWVEATDFRCVQ